MVVIPEAAAFEEKTWHRILVAENLRRMLERLSVSPCWTLDQGLSNILCRYKSLYETSLLQLDMVPSTMVFDRRIRFENSLQLGLIEYLERGVASLARETSEAVSSKSPVETAAALLKQMVTESPGKTQDQLLLRYMNEAPQSLKFPTKQDLRELLQFIAVREKREGDSQKEWHLLSDHPSLDCWHVKPGASRRQQRRRAEKQSRGDMPVNEDLLEDGAQAELQWFELLKWPNEIAYLLSQ